MSLRDEVTELARALVRVDTSNPPGNETNAAELLREYLAGSGVEAELYARVPERANLVARLPGGDGPKVVFCTTENDVAHIARALHAGANEYIMKPFDKEIVEAKFQEVGLI